MIRDLDHNLHLLKRHLPYHESDHVLNIAFNILAGGQRLEHIERRRNDEVYLDALGAERIPDPTTEGDFCRRFTATDIQTLLDTLNGVRRRVWRNNLRSSSTRRSSTPTAPSSPPLASASRGSICPTTASGAITP